MARVEITDEESARAWLEGQPHQVQIWFAARCALRVLPVVALEPTEQIGHIAFAAFRATLISAAAATGAASEISDLQIAASAAHSAAAIFAANSIASADARAASAAASSAAHSVAVFASAYSTRNAVGAARNANNATALSTTLAAASDDTAMPGGWPPLWRNGTIADELAPLWDRLRQHLKATPETWVFWLDWYEAILEGRPLPWDLSLRIAKDVTEAEWDAGPEVVASRIAEIRARYELEQRISDLEQERDRYRKQVSRLGIGGNNPPEPLEDIAVLRRETAIIWAAIDDLKAETAAPTPDKARIGQIVDILSHGLVAIARWLGGKGDLAIDTLIKWGMPVGAGTLLARPELLEAVVGAARQWLHLIP